MIKLSENKIEGPFEIFEDFFKAVDNAVSDKDIIYVSVENGFLIMYSEDKYDGMSAGASVYCKMPVEGSSTDFSFGVEAVVLVNFFNSVKFNLSHPFSCNTIIFSYLFKCFWLLSAQCKSSFDNLF